MWRVLRENRGLLTRFAIPHLVIACGAGLCIPFLGLYFQDRFEVAPGAVANLYAAGQVLVTLGFLGTPWLLARTSFVRSIVILELASIPFFLMLAFTTSLPVAIGAFLARGALMNAATPVLKHFSMRAVREEVRELQNGITSLVYGLGWVIGPQIGGQLLDASGDNYRVLMCTTVGFYVAAAVATMVLLSPLEKSAGVG
jgi:predicted MFS family arabinose efflux permease